jgi:hypothetical protein
MISFYSLLNNDLSWNLKSFEYPEGTFTPKSSVNRNFQEMGYITISFIPLQYKVIIVLLMIIFLGILLKLVIIATRRNFRIQAMRYIGMFMPKETVFKRILWRFYQLLFMQIFLSAYTEVINSTVISDEKTNMDGLSLIMAYFAMVITVPFMIHMFYGIIEYVEFLEDDDI